MVVENTQANGRLTNKFSFFDKLFMGIGFYAVTAIGVYGIYRESVIYGLLYVGFLVFGFLVLFGYGLCAHCPHPYKHSDCLFPPFGQLFTKMYKFRPEPATIIDKTAFFVIMGGIVVIPQYWLFKDYTLLAIFWIFCILTCAGFLLFECRRCRNVNCPFNMAKQGSVNGA
ncbi:MAG: hypothetical protein SV775_07715 [Thermodesulfobacteriota bacterium]|nr:hypothetical protein [Thermodesulfobacteriota bacterium]